MKNKYLILIFLLLISTLFFYCEDVEPEPIKDNSSSKSAASIVLYDDSETLEDRAYKIYAINRSGTFNIRITVDNNDGLKFYINGSYKRRITSSYSDTLDLTIGDILKLENDGVFGLGDSITYTLYLGD